MTDAPGWYGKLPTLGDFASHRLDGAFIEPWDLWLGEGLAAHRERLGDAWLEGYLRSAVWRFVLMPEAVSPLQQQPMAGVLMPSVDRVGRYFPFTLAATLPHPPRDAGGVERLLGWLQALEDIAIDALQDDWTVEQLEEVLAAFPRFAVSGSEDGVDDRLAAARQSLVQAVQGGSGFVDISPVHSRVELASLFAAAAGALPAPPLPLKGRAFWLADVPGEARLLVSHGLPSPERFIEMLGASGREAGQTTLF